jgi:hypothetical protein
MASVSFASCHIPAHLHMVMPLSCIFFQACFFGIMLAHWHGLRLVLSFMDSCLLTDSPHSCMLSIGFVHFHFHLPSIHMLSVRFRFIRSLSQSEFSCASIGFAWTHNNKLILFFSWFGATESMGINSHLQL